MYKMLIIGDSSSLPRIELEYYSTFYAKLKSMYEVETTAKTNNNSYKIYTDIESLTLYGFNPIVVILNYGIVDVFPRPYPNVIYRFLSCSGLLPYIDKFLKKTKLYYRLGDFFNFKEVPLDKFEFYSHGIIKKLLDKKVEKIIVIGIIRPYKVLLNSKKVDREIQKYNEVFKNLSHNFKEVEYIDIYSASDEDFTIWDGYHYSEKASKYIAEEIAKLLND